jgi:hypothetical protein
MEKMVKPIWAGISILDSWLLFILYPAAILLILRVCSFRFGSRFRLHQARSVSQRRLQAQGH